MPALSLPPSGVWETTQSTGTGDIVLEGAVEGFRPFGSAENGGTFPICIRNGSMFELSEATYTHATRTLTRNTVKANHLGTTAKVNFPAGIKQVFIEVGSEMVAFLNRQNIFEQDQILRTNSLIMGNSDGSSIVADSDDQSMDFYVATKKFLRLDDQYKTAYIMLDRSDAQEGPSLELYRINASPAANNSGGVLRWTMHDAGNAKRTAAKARSVITDPSSGAMSTELRFEVLAGGTLGNQFTISRDHVRTAPYVDVLVGKQTNDIGVVGIELYNRGAIAISVEEGSGPGLIVNNLGNDAEWASFQRNGEIKGRIVEVGGTLTYEAFSGSHPTRWEPGHEPVGLLPPQGTVVVAGDGTMEKYGERIPLVRVSSEQGDKAVLGVCAGVEFMTGGDYEVKVVSVGMSHIRVVGPVKRGDLLWTSKIEGCAEAQPDDIYRGHTIGKVYATDNSPGERLLPVALTTAG